MGVYSEFDVDWPPLYAKWLERFKLANLDLGVLQLACMPFTWAEIWYIQVFVLPLLYVVYVILDIGIARLLLTFFNANEAVSSDSIVGYMLRAGYRPRVDYSWKGLRENCAHLRAARVARAAPRTQMLCSRRVG